MSGFLSKVAAIIAANIWGIWMVLILSAAFSNYFFQDTNLCLATLFLSIANLVLTIFKDKLLSIWNAVSLIFKRYYGILIGHGVWSAVSWVYNEPIYIYFIAKFGPVDGGIIMALGSMFICFGMLFYYRRKKVEWLGYDVAVEALTERAHDWSCKLSEWRKQKGFILSNFASLVSLPVQLFVPVIDFLTFISIFISWLIYVPAQMFILILKAMNIRIIGDVVVFFALSILEDPFLTTAYVRHGRTDGLKAWDLIVFVASVITSNAWWTFRTVIVIKLAVLFWGLWTSLVGLVSLLFAG